MHFVMHLFTLTLGSDCVILQEVLTHRLRNHSYECALFF